MKDAAIVTWPQGYRNKRYYYWTEHNRRMRFVDPSKLDFGGDKVQAVPLDVVRREDIEDRTQDFETK